MRFMILRMLSTNSLAAFSASVAQTGLSSRAGASPAGGASSTGPVTRVRATGMQGQPQATPQKLLPAEGAGPPAGRTLPRGSLLDLSV
jgi:hypothetical protein